MPLLPLPLVPLPRFSRRDSRRLSPSLRPQVRPLPLLELPEVLLELPLLELLLLRFDPLPLLLRLELLLPPPRPELPRTGRSESLLLERLDPLELLPLELLPLELLLLELLELLEPLPLPPRLPCARALVRLIKPAPSTAKAIRNAR